MDPTETTTTPDEPAVDLTEAAVAALDEGIAAAEPASPEPTPPADAPAESTPEGAKPADVPGQPVAEPKADDAPKTPTVEEEIATLGLKARAAERFKALSGEVASLKGALEQAGIPSVDALPVLAERAKFADELETAIQSTGASPEQYGQAIKWLALANSGKPDDAAQALDLVMETAKQLAQALGRELPGLHDPLADHPDLQEEVEAGDITRKRAIELAQQRATRALTEGTAKQAESQQRQQAEFTQAIESLNTLGAQLKARDPRYAEKIAALQPTIALIRERCPPSEWPARVQAAYQQVVLPPPAAAPLPPPGPVRSPAVGGVSIQPQPKDEMEALEIGLGLAARAR